MVSLGLNELKRGWIPRGRSLSLLVAIFGRLAFNDLFQYQDRLSKYSSYHKDKTAMAPFYLYNGNCFIGKAASLYWDRFKEALSILHYSDVIMGAIASQITSLTIVYSIDYSDANQRKHQGSASLAFVRGIHRGPMNSPHKWPVTRKMSPFDDVITWAAGVVHPKRAATRNKTTDRHFAWRRRRPRWNRKTQLTDR